MPPPPSYVYRRKIFLRSQARLAPRLASRSLMPPLHLKHSLVLYNDRVVSPSHWVPAVVTGVHLDDGPDDPYYTVEFRRGGEKVEKQTQPERIRADPLGDAGGGEEAAGEGAAVGGGEKLGGGGGNLTQEERRKAAADAATLRAAGYKM
ncbi:hypothetical protein TeGR_g7297 [Tetraparma gracilis]|uniref:Uncharacterized protein n=1 Tax=Tetraparma gracilis TaxID=2962635 RepID=A0ABQ6MR65_9STRA|nr:hypothetical protein TeGR_g7297 [Tetraparma gracilis]